MISEHALHVHSLGSFSVSIAGEKLSSPWPDELTRGLFCSLLSPLDECITFDRLSRSLLGAAVEGSAKTSLEEVIENLVVFFKTEMGADPFRYTEDAIGFNRNAVRVDAHHFQKLALEGLREMSIGNTHAARLNISSALALYEGDFLPGMRQKIIDDTRGELDSLKQMITRLILQPSVRKLPRYSPCRGLFSSTAAVFG